METLGSWGTQGLNFIKDIGSRIAEATGEKRSNYFIFQATYNEVPDLSGYVVFDYRTYGHLNFITLPVPDPVEELDVNLF